MLDLIKNRYLQSLLTIEERVTKEGKDLDILIDWAKAPFGKEAFMFEAFQKEDVYAAARIWAGMKDLGLTTKDVKDQIGKNTHAHQRTRKSMGVIQRVCPICGGEMRLFPENEDESQWICNDCSLGIYNPESAGEVMGYGR